MCDADEEMINVVAKALQDAMPELTHPEAWPWKTLARAAIGALEDHWRSEIPAGPFTGDPQMPDDVP